MLAELNNNSNAHQAICVVEITVNKALGIATISTLHMPYKKFLRKFPKFNCDLMSVNFRPLA